jgi:hypothetical protein
MECPVCGLNCTEGRCSHQDSFVADVSIEEVIGQAEDLLSMPHPSAGSSSTSVFSSDLREGHL